LLDADDLFPDTRAVELARMTFGLRVPGPLYWVQEQCGKPATG
jgi:hypothetical protein